MDSIYGVVKKTTKTDIIVDNIMSLIREKKLSPGDKIPSERELVQLMHVSRPSLREAVKALEVMNLLEVRHGSGVFIKRLEPEGIVTHLELAFTMDETLNRELYIARRTLETMTARLAAEHISEEDLLRMEQNLREGEKAVDDPERFLELDMELHRLILNASVNRILQVFAQSIEDLSLIMRKKTNSSRSVRERTIKDHELIYYALKDHDSEQTARAMESHLKHVENYFSKQHIEEEDKNE